MRAEEGDETVQDYAEEAKAAKKRVEEAVDEAAEPASAGDDVGPSGRR